VTIGLNSKTEDIGCCVLTWDAGTRPRRICARGDRCGSSPHARALFALYEVAQGRCPSQVARCSGRHPQTVMQWVHQYQESGPEALAFWHTRGPPPFARRSNRRSVA
jgi:hypothetical protein